EVRLLGDHADRAGEGVEVEVADVDPVECDPAAGHVVQTGHEVAERGLAGPGGADDREAGARGDGDVDAVEDRAALAVVAEGDVLEADLALDPVEAHRILALGDVDRDAEVLEDALEQRERGLDLQAGGSKLRGAGASEAWMCTPGGGRLPAGRNRPCWSEANATMVPPETAGPPLCRAMPAVQ